MPDRRAVLALIASLVGLPLAGGPALALAPVAAARPEVRRYGRHFIVNGWVLTARDLARLGLAPTSLADQPMEV